jgi:hypothetical protein
MPKKTKVEVISDGRDIFVVVDGLKIAKRGHHSTYNAYVPNVSVSPDGALCFVAAPSY